MTFPEITCLENFGYMTKKKLGIWTLSQTEIPTGEEQKEDYICPSLSALQDQAKIKL